MHIPHHNESSEGESRTYETIISDYYASQRILKEIHKGAGCPICGSTGGQSKLSRHAHVCESCLQKIESDRLIIEEHLFQKAVRMEKISSNEIPFLISLPDQEKYNLLFRFFQKQTEIGQKETLGLVRTFVDLLQIPTDTDYFFETFYPRYLKEFTTKPGLLPRWCTDVPIGLREIRKPGEMIHYIDTMVIFDQKEVFTKRKTGKLFTLTWGRDRIYSHAKAGEETEWEYFETYRGTVVISSERIIPFLSDGTYPFVFLNARITKLIVNPDGVEIFIDGHDRPYCITGMNQNRGWNIRFCLENLVKIGTVIEEK